MSVSVEARNNENAPGIPVNEHDKVHLFEPLQQKSVTIHNRIGVSPMCMYSCKDGLLNDYHVMHYGSFAFKGAGLVIIEASAVVPEGRISPADSGIWSDAHIEPIARVVNLVKSQGGAIGIQIAHAGRKASMSPPFKGDYVESEANGGWPNAVVGPSEIPFADHYPKPHAMTVQEIKHTVQAFADAAVRADKAGIDVLEIHAAHGYLLHNFYSGNSNRRTDEYGGSFENRIRFLLEVVQAVRQVWPAQKPLWVRISAADYTNPEPMGSDPDGWSIDQSIELAKALKQLGVDLVDCSSGGNVKGVKYPSQPLYQVPFAEAIRREAGLATAAVGLITEGEEAEAIIKEGKADMVLVAREFLRNSAFALCAAQSLNIDIQWPKQYSWAAKSIFYSFLLFLALIDFTQSNSTLFEILSNTQSSPVQWISQFLQDSSEITDLLSQADRNLTLFIPSDDVYQAILSNDNGQTSPESSNNSSQTPGSDDPSGDGSSSSDVPSSGISSVKILADKTNYTDYFTNPYIQDFNLSDVIYYHIVNQSINIENWFNNSSDTDGDNLNNSSMTGNNTSDDNIVYNATILSTLVSNSTLDELGIGVPLVLQKIKNNDTSVDNSTFSSDESDIDENNKFNYTIGGSVSYANVNLTNVVQASNGYIYIIDKVLVPPVSLNETIEALVHGTNITTPFSNLTDSYNVTQFEQLLMTLNSTNFTAFDLYTNMTNVTYFVPIDTAFENLTQLNNQSIDDLLASHIVQGLYYTSNITNATVIQTLAGTNITFAKNDTGFIVNNTNIVQPNILLDLGVLHLIDGVLNYTTDSANTTSAVDGIDNPFDSGILA
ncbi:hypothetical protein G6F37_007656 [Rhizopus arrhizus]|nr:hypothetical protein G6F38_007774 [Rhizopus arrhizus]KAG1156385.1 hypothetical protein G6F37_007656 [Rhizopus arrhizus]